jgi:hypothetical protein
MIDFECPGVPQLQDTRREIIVSGTPARPPIIPFFGYEHIRFYEFMIPEPSLWTTPPPKNVGRLICRYIDREKSTVCFCANLL